MRWQVSGIRARQGTLFLAVAMFSLISGCGGGGGSTTSASSTPSPAQSGISLIAGAAGGQTTPGASFSSNSPGIGTDSSGNIYLMDGGNIRVVSASGQVTTRSGGPNLMSMLPMGPANEKTQGFTPFALDQFGNIYAPIKTYDGFSGGINRLDRDGILTTVPGTAGLGAIAVAVDTAGNVFAIDDFNISVRKITPSGTITTIANFAALLDAAPGAFKPACSEHYFAIAVDGSGNIHIASSQRVRKIDAKGTLSVLAGSSPTQCSWNSATLPPAGSIKDGTGDQAKFLGISSMTIDSAGNLLVADANTIRKITPAGVVTTIAGNPGSVGVRLGALPGSLTGPSGIAVLPSASGTRIVAMDERSLLAIALD